MLSCCPRVCLCGKVPRRTSGMRLIFTPVGVNRGLLCVQVHTLHVRRMCVCVCGVYVCIDAYTYAVWGDRVTSALLRDVFPRSARLRHCPSRPSGFPVFSLLLTRTLSLSVAPCAQRSLSAPPPRSRPSLLLAPIVRLRRVLCRLHGTDGSSPCRHSQEPTRGC